MHMHCSKIGLKMFKFKVVQHTVHPLNQTFTLLASSPLLLRCSTPGLRWGLLLVPYTIYSRPLCATTVVLCGWFQPNSRFMSYPLRRSSSSCRVVLRKKAPRSSLQISFELWIAFRCNLGSPSCWSTCLRTQNFWFQRWGYYYLWQQVYVASSSNMSTRVRTEWSFTEWLPSVFLIGDFHTFPNTPLVGQCWTKLLAELQILWQPAETHIAQLELSMVLYALVERPDLIDNVQSKSNWPDDISTLGVSDPWWRRHGFNFIRRIFLHPFLAAFRSSHPQLWISLVLWEF